MTHEATGKDGTARESDLAREESGKSDLVERLRALRRFLNGEGELDGYSFGDVKPITRDRVGRFWWRREHLPTIDEAANALATVEAERDEALMIAEGPSTLKELAALAIENNARAFTAETRLSGMVEAVKGMQAKIEVAISVLHAKGLYKNGAGYTTDAALWLDRASSEALSALADIEGSPSRDSDCPTPDGANADALDPDQVQP